MKLKTSNKLNILLLAIILLLLFAVGFNAMGNTHSWLIDDEEIGFEINVQGIDVVVKQGTRVIENETGFIYLDPNNALTTNYIQADTDYTLGITITNQEEGNGYYVRSQLFLVANGVAYNINDCVTGDFAIDGKWMYSVDSQGNKVAMAASGQQGSSFTIINKIRFPQSFIDQIEGQFIKLHLFVEGSANGTFDS